MFIKYYPYFFNVITGKFIRFLFVGKFLMIFSKFKDSFKNKKGLEIGGPTKLFATQSLPIYKYAKKIDECNFSKNTIWIDNANGISAHLEGKLGSILICEGSNISEITDESYDFILSSHNLEHFANPIKALKEWLRVLKTGGTILLVVPEKKYMFDRKRDFTSFEHLIDDFKNEIDETDMTHLNEVLEKHDFNFDPDAKGNFTSFKNRCINNFEYRSLHHHVFSHEVLKKLFLYLDIKIICQYNIPLFHQIIVGKKQ